MREIEDMGTQQIREGRKQRGRSTYRKPGVYRAIVTFVLVTGILVACTTGDDTQAGATGSSPTPDPSSSVDAAEPGPYVFKTDDPDFDAKYRITMDLLNGYSDDDMDYVVLGTDGGQGMSAWTVGNVYAEPCRWTGTLLDPRSIHRSTASSTA